MFLNKFPGPKHRRLPAGSACFRNQIPNRCARDAKSPSVFGNAHAGIIVDKSSPFHLVQKPRAFFAIRRFRRKTRRRPREFFPGHFPQTERRAIAVIQNWIGFRSV